MTLAASSGWLALSLAKVVRCLYHDASLPCPRVAGVWRLQGPRGADPHFFSEVCGKRCGHHCQSFRINLLEHRCGICRGRCRFHGDWLAPKTCVFAAGAGMGAAATGASFVACPEAWTAADNAFNCSWNSLRSCSAVRLNILRELRYTASQPAITTATISTFMIPPGSERNEPVLLGWTKFALGVQSFQRVRQVFSGFGRFNHIVDNRRRADT